MQQPPPPSYGTPPYPGPPGPPPPPYGAPPYPGSPPQAGFGMAPRRSGAALASLILSLVGICPLIITSIIGFILGIVALLQIRKAHGMLRGKGMAITGIVLGIVFPVIYGIIGLVAYYFVSDAVENSRQTVDHFLSAIDKGDYETAYRDYTTRSYRERVSFDEFKEKYKRFSEENGGYEGCSFSLYKGNTVSAYTTPKGNTVTILLTVRYSRTGEFKKIFFLVCEPDEDEYRIASDDVPLVPEF